MSRSVRSALVATSFLIAGSVGAGAQSPPVMSDLLADVSGVESKLVGLARAVPAAKYDWRPAPDIRSIGEVFMHVASDNYLLPAMLGTPADPSTGIKGEDYKTAAAFEKRKLGRDAIIAELEKSFVHLKRAMSAVTADQLAKPVSFFGQPFTIEKAWIGATTHLHEHLGQSIAYARSNSVVPPWSK
jgi:hypothetical protein